MPAESTTAIAKQFEADGFYHAKGVFSDEMLQQLQSSFDRIVEHLRNSGEDINARWQSAVDRLGAGDRQIIHTHQVHCYDAIWLQALMHPDFLHVARAILGDDVILHHTKLFHKPPRVGGPFPMHQDWAYFPTIKDSMIAGVIHLSDADIDNGCLRVVPGSHRLGRRQGTSGNSSHHGKEDLDFLAAYPIEQCQAVSCAAGDVVFFHYFTLHGSGTNDSDRARRTVLAQLHAGDDHCENDNRHANARMPLHGFNSHMRRSMAPVSTA